MIGNVFMKRTQILFTNSIRRWLLAIALIAFLNPGIILGEDEYGLDEFDDLDLRELHRYSKKDRKQNKKKLILFDDNLYLLDDEFDFGEDEIELEKLELNPNEIETFKEYEDFLNAFFENSTKVGTKAYGKTSKSYDKPKRSKGSQTKAARKSKGRSSQSKPPYKPVGKLGFGITTILGTTIPMGQNLTDQFSSGSNFGIRLDTPISFYLGKLEAKVGTEFYISSMTAGSPDGSDYNLINMVGNISVFPKKYLEVRAGLGLTPASIGDESKMLFSLPVDVNFYIPFNFAGFRIALNLHAQETLGIPTDTGSEDTKATSEFINVGLLINTPLVF